MTLLNQYILKNSFELDFDLDNSIGVMLDEYELEMNTPGLEEYFKTNLIISTNDPNYNTYITLMKTNKLLMKFLLCVNKERKEFRHMILDMIENAFFLEHCNIIGADSKINPPSFQVFKKIFKLNGDLLYNFNQRKDKIIDSLNNDIIVLRQKLSDVEAQLQSTVDKIKQNVELETLSIKLENQTIKNENAKLQEKLKRLREKTMLMIGVDSNPQNISISDKFLKMNTSNCTSFENLEKKELTGSDLPLTPPATMKDVFDVLNISKTSKTSTASKSSMGRKKQKDSESPKNDNNNNKFSTSEAKQKNKANQNSFTSQTEIKSQKNSKNTIFEDRASSKLFSSEDKRYSISIQKGHDNNLTANGANTTKKHSKRPSLSLSMSTANLKPKSLVASNNAPQTPTGTKNYSQGGLLPPRNPTHLKNGVKKNQVRYIKNNDK